MSNGLWALGAAIVAFIISYVLGKVLIPYLHKLKFGQTILDIGPDWHKKKQGTPTMGGIMFIVGIVLSAVVFFTVRILVNNNVPDIQKSKFFAGLIMATLYGVIGFIDDYIKVVKKRNLGLTAIQKLVMQFSVVGLYLFALYLIEGEHVTRTIIPFVNDGKPVDLDWFFYVIAALVIVGITNATNLTDGVDGLLGSITFFASIFVMIIATFLLDVGAIIECAALAGGLLGFLMWNFHPAKVFMGDTGSLFLGGMVCAIMFSINMPILLLLVGIVYLAEMFSVMLQVAYFKATHGKRIFRMSPIHHHFELGGMPETKVVYMFWSWGAILSLLGILMGVMM